MFEGVILLGNPGKQYAATRHNLAWLAAEQLPGYNDLQWIKKFKGQYTRYTPAGRTLLLKPGVYMNKSGESVLPFMQFFKLTPAKLLVVHDDLELEFGTISLKEGGGLGGHNGLRSIAALLGTRDFYRCRLGISRPGRASVSSYVLSPFSKEEDVWLPQYLNRTAALLTEAFSLPPEKAVEKMQRMNTLE